VPTEDCVKDTLRKLAEAFGPSGREERVRDIIRQEIEGLVDEVQVDAMGNLLAVKRAPGKRVLITAHMDEIGIIVTHVDTNGYLRFSSIGGLSPITLIGSRVRFADGTVGTINVEKLDDPTKVPDMAKMYIDVGTLDGQVGPIRVGDIGCMDRSLVEQAGVFVAKALDDRAGCAAVIEALRRLQKLRNEAWFVFTTQEEVGLRGATTASYRVDPQVAIAVDVTLTGDTPKAPPMAVSLGKGAAIKVRDGGMLAHPGLKDLIVRRAQEAGIPHQLEVLERGTTDACAMQLTRAGVPAGAISVPCRYVHTASEMVSSADLDAVSSLIVAVLENEIEL